MKAASTYFSFLLLLGILAVGCKKDKGNYSYSTVPLPVIDTAGIGAPYYIQKLTSLVVDPAIVYEGGNVQALTYKWLLYPHVIGSVGSIPVKTISTQKKLDVPIGENVGEYRVELIVTDTTNQLKVNTVFNLIVSVGIEYGFMVLHTTGNESDVDFVITSNAVPVAGIAPRRLNNIYSAALGEKIPGAPRFLVQERRTGSVQNWIMVASSEQFSRMKGSDFSLMRENRAFFRRTDEVINPQAFMFLNNSQSALINNNRLHLYSTTYEVDALFGGSIPGDYELAPFLPFAASSGLVAPVYDNKYGRFIRPASAIGSMIDFNAPSNPATAPFDLRNIGKTMLYMDRGFSSHTHAFFSDKTGNGRWLYVANFNAASDNGALAIGKYDMTALPEISAAKFFQSSEQGYVDWYATERNIYSYDFQGTQTATLEYSSFPQGETITCMKVYKPRPNFNLSTVEGRILYVATWNGTQGKLYEFGLNPISGQITPTPLNVFEGFGRITDMTAKARGSGTY